MEEKNRKDEKKKKKKNKNGEDAFKYLTGKLLYLKAFFLKMKKKKKNI